MSQQGARLRSLATEDDSWLVSFSRSLLGGGSSETKRSRLWQIAATLAPLGDEALAVIATEGRAVTTLRLGVKPGVWRGETGENDYFYVVRGVQRRLAELGYLDRSDVSGTSDYLTEQALLAFQGWEDLDRTGTVTGQTQIALFRASKPRPAARRLGKRIEIYRDKGVLLMAEDGDVVRAVHASTGASGWSTIADGVTTVTTYTVTGLANGTRYYFRVLATNGVGRSPPSNVANAVPRTVPSAPRTLTATPTNASGQVRLSWIFPASNGGAALSDYAIERSVNGTSGWTTILYAVQTSRSCCSLPRPQRNVGSSRWSRTYLRTAGGVSRFGSTLTAITRSPARFAVCERSAVLRLPAITGQTSGHHV